MALLCVFLVLGISSTHAQEETQDASSEITSQISEVLDMPAQSKTTHDDRAMTYPMLHLTQDKSEMIKLNNEAASVVVGNPNHISVLLDTPTTLVVVPRKAGASHFSVIGKDGNIVMQRHVIVGAAKDNYVRIRRSCNANSGANCQKTSTYFCPGTCHEVQENAQ